MVCDSGGAEERIPARTSMNTRHEGNLTQELNHCIGQGAVKTFWPRWGYVGNGGCHETCISIFIYLCIYRVHWQIEHRGQCSFKGEGIVTPMFPQVCKYNYIDQQTMENSICVNVWLDEHLYKISMNVIYVINRKWISVS